MANSPLVKTALFASDPNLGRLLMAIGNAGVAGLDTSRVQVSLGDLPHDSIGYQSIFAAGLVLMIFTLVLNVIGFFLTRRFREAY